LRTRKQASSRAIVTCGEPAPPQDCGTTLNCMGSAGGLALPSDADDCVPRMGFRRTLRSSRPCTVSWLADLGSTSARPMGACSGEPLWRVCRSRVRDSQVSELVRSQAMPRSRRRSVNESSSFDNQREGAWNPQAPRVTPPRQKGRALPTPQVGERTENKAKRVFRALPRRRSLSPRPSLPLYVRNRASTSRNKGQGESCARVGARTRAVAVRASLYCRAIAILSRSSGEIM
jgi:hypothetical protein